MATLVKIDRNGSKHFEGMVKCDRCGGQGGSDGWKYTGYTCYKCGGSGQVFAKWIERTPEYEEKLRAKRQAKIEARMKEQEEQEQIRRREEEERIKVEKAISKYVGEVGQKIETRCTFVKTAWFDCTFGWTKERIFVHTFKDMDGNKLIWRTSSKGNLGLEDGQEITLFGTVKEHSEYKDEKQTSLIRCKIQK